MGKESKLERKLTEGVKAKKGLCVKLYSTWFTGLPDRLVLLQGGKVVFIELKADEEATRISEKRQRRQGFVRRQLQQLGFTTYILDTEEKIKEFLNAI